MSLSYKEIAAKKRAERDSKLVKEWEIPKDKLPSSDDVLKFPETSGLLNPEELEITGSDAPTIFSNIKAKKWTSYQVTKAFCHRSQIAHQLTNCLSEIFYDQALKQAEALDKYYEETGKLKGRFHGVPISLKDNINLIGQASTVGYVDWCFKPEGGLTYNSAIAQMLLDEGAVFYAKTNVPVAMMIAETVNHVYGTTTNPYNRKLSPGGSSGGCSAHAALRGSVIDIGSDIGGSIRIPGSFTGLYSLRPTSGRFPTYGTRSGLPGLESVSSVNGPLCASLPSLEWYLKNMAEGDPSLYDPKVAFRAWVPPNLPEKLSFAILVDDGFVRPTPPIRRGIAQVKKLVEEAGHEVIEWEAGELHTQLAKFIGDFFLSDGGKHVLSVTEATGEPLFPAMDGYGAAKDITVSQLWDLHADRTTVCSQFLKKWAETKSKTKSGRPIDAILMPTTPHPGCPHGEFGQYVGYTSFVNCLDYSAGTVPVTRVDKSIDVIDENYIPRNEFDERVYKSYSPELAHGGSVSCQIVCRKHEDEKVVELMKVLSKLIKYEI